MEGGEGGRRDKEELSRGLRGRKTGKPEEGGEPAKRGGEREEEKEESEGISALTQVEFGSPRGTGSL